MKLETDQNKEIENYELYSVNQRRFYLAIVAFAGLMAPMSATMFFPALIQIKEDFQTTDTLIDLTVSIFVFVLAIAPLVWGTCADLYGRRWVYITAQVIFALSCVGCGLSPNIAVFLLMRVFQGIGSSATIVLGIGTISDIYPRDQRGTAFGLFFVGPLIGPIIGPIIGGFLAQYLGWRSIFWLMIGLSGAILIIMIVFLKETMAESRMEPFPVKISFFPFSFKFNGMLFNPFKSLYYLRYINVALGSFYTAIIFASYYAVSTSQNRAMFNNYHLTASTTGLTFLSLGVGNITGSICGGRVSDLLLKRAIKRSKDNKAHPEIRLYSSFIGAISILIGLGLNGWFIQYQFHLGLVLFAQFLIGFGMTYAFGCTSTYLIDLYPRFAASITSASNSVRMIASGIIVTLNSIILDKLDYGWTFTMFAFMHGVGIAILIVLIAFSSKFTHS
ncbi:MFS general substrate transporter [Neoconidiobolus thromboides FSU 785]|nr:MFS general substrate transporter [Neoconidiobolus thromboides FSU 785]